MKQAQFPSPPASVKPLATEAETFKPKREKKKVEYAGSRWAGLILLLLTILASLSFYLYGSWLSGKDVSTGGQGLPGSGQATYRFEK